MKTWHFFTIAFLLIYSTSSGQIKVDKYCILKASNLKFDKEKVTIKITFGQQDSLFSFKDSSIVYNLKMVEKQITLADAFNYLGSIGWTYLNQWTIAYQGEYLFSFKKTFDKSELK